MRNSAVAVKRAIKEKYYCSIAKQIRNPIVQCFVVEYKEYAQHITKGVEEKYSPAGQKNLFLLNCLSDKCCQCLF